MKHWINAIVFLLTASLGSLFASAFLAQESEERVRYYEKWLKQDVLYIVTPDEQDVFEKLTTFDEKDNFIEQFWKRRDTDPRTGINEFKEEHYRRIAYANERFSSGQRGWRTDRGRVYIIHGPPDETTYHQGGSMVTSALEGNNTITAWPFELWRYRYLPGIGQNIELEFVDKSGNGKFVLVVNEYEKYNMAHLHGQGRAATDLFGHLMEQGVWTTRNLELNSPGPHRRAKAFDRVLNLFEVMRPPKLKFAELATAVDTRIHYDEIPFDSSRHWFLVSEGRFLAAVTLRIGHEQLSFKANYEGQEISEVELYGRVIDLLGKVIFEFEDLLTARRPEGTTQAGSMLYQRYLPLPKGRFKLQLIVKDISSGRLGSKEELLLLPGFKTDELTVGPVVLADLIGGCGPNELLPDPFVTMNRLKIYPNVDHVVARDRALGIYFEIYNSHLDAASQKPSLDVSFQLERSGEKVTTPFHTMPVEPLSVLEDRLACVRAIQVKDLPAGSYTLNIKVQDKISGRSTTGETSFTLRGKQTPRDSG